MLLRLVPFVAVACMVSCLLSCRVGANVGDLDAPPPDSGANVPGAGDAEAGSTPTPTNDADSDAESDAETPIDAGCGVTFGQRGSFIDVGVVVGPTPNLAGGPVAPGMYTLVAMRVHFGSAAGTMQVRETMRVRGSATAGAFDRLTEARNATGTFVDYPLHGEIITWAAMAGPNYFYTPECPKEDFERAGRFDMKGDTLTLFDDMDAIERVYRRVP